MGKFRTFMLGAALALPLAAFGAIGDVGSTDAAVPPSVEQGASSQYRCCWIFFGGTWWCIAC